MATLMERNANIDGACSRCHWRVALCLCHQAPRLTPLLHLLLLTHERELSKLSNTGRLLEASLPNCEIQVWQRKTSGAEIVELAKSRGQQPILLFPSQEVAVGSSDTPTAENLTTKSLRASSVALECYWFILLDGTWQQASKMVRTSPELQSLPHLALPAGLSSRYSLRKNQQPGNLSTVETAIILLHSLGLDTSASGLEQYFQRFLQHHEAQRSNHLCIS